ncbi:MAG: hypothetical protein J1F63_06470 [Oscillospiraceae bacterium]|nr:hypothetical protein [Oscillospiraceae bacterium]
MELKEIAKIDISRAGKFCRMWLGDINGDGRMEIIMVQPDSDLDDRYFPHSVYCATAFDLCGNLLWQIGEPDPNAKSSGADIPAQVYDIDGDGSLEFICARDGKLQIYDGKTAELKREAPLPDQYAHDCIIIADLEGKGRPQNIILKNRYEKLWALDSDLNVMWEHVGNVGHYPWPHDLDGDGREELIAGYTVLSGDGKPLWEIDMKDHADCIWIGDINADGKPEVVVGGDDITAWTNDGRLLWRFDDTVESQNVAIGNIRPELPGLEICGLDRIDRGNPGLDGIFIVSSEGNSLYKEHRTVPGWSSVCTVISNLDGKGTDNVLAYRRGALPNAVYDGYLNTIFNFPFDGYVLWGDLTGNGANQLIVYSQTEALIYSATDVDLNVKAAHPLPQPKRLYNNTRYWGGEASNINSTK